MQCMVCAALQCESHNFPHPGRIACRSAPSSRPPATKALHTMCGNNTRIVSSSWWWAYKCPKHVEQIISAVKHSVASSWFPSIRPLKCLTLLHRHWACFIYVKSISRDLKLCHPRCVRLIIQSRSLYLSIYTYSHEHNNVTISSNI